MPEGNVCNQWGAWGVMDIDEAENTAKVWSKRIEAYKTTKENK